MKQVKQKDYVWNTIGVLLQNAISPLLLIVVTRVNGIYDSGLFSFAFSLAIIFWAISMWGGRTYQVSDTKRDFAVQSYIAVRIILAIAVVIGAFLFATASQYDEVKTALIMTLVSVKVVESMADVLYGVLQKHNKLYITGISLTYKAVLGFAAFVVVDSVTQSLQLSCLALLAVNILFLIAYDIRRASAVENLKPKLFLGRGVYTGALQIMRKCAPIFAMTLLAMLSLNIPRYFLDMYHSEQIGYFGIIAMPITLIVLVMSFILQPNVLELSRLHEQKRYIEFRRIVRNIINITILVGALILIGTYLIGVEALELVFGVSFTQFKLALMIIVGGAVLNALIAVIMNVLIITRYIKVQFYILFITSLILVVASYGVVDKFALIGCAFLFSGVSAVQLLLLGISYLRIQKRLDYAKEN